MAFYDKAMELKTPVHTLAHMQDNEITLFGGEFKLEGEPEMFVVYSRGVDAELLREWFEKRQEEVNADD